MPTDLSTRFVILRHEPGTQGPRPLHWDLLLESGGVLRAWALERAPVPGATITAEALADHRREYLDYDGPVSGGRGHVTRVDGGSYEVLRASERLLVVRLNGRAWAGEVKLTKAEDGQRWMVEFAET